MLYYRDRRRISEEEEIRQKWRGNTYANGEKKKNSPSLTAIYAALVSTLSLSLTALQYYNQSLRMGTLSLFHGRVLQIMYDNEGRPAIIMPVVYVNTGVRPRVIVKTRLVLRNPVDAQSIELSPHRYMNRMSITEPADLPSPELIAGDSALKRLALFEVSTRPVPKFRWESRQYDVTVEVTESNSHILTRTYQITPSPESIQFIQQKQGNSYDVWIIG